MPIEPVPVMGGFVISEANGMRSRANGVLLASNGIVAAGTPLKGPVTGMAPGKISTDAATIIGILLYTVDTGTGANLEVSILARDAEVNESMLVYGGMVPSAVETQLNTLGIYVRHSVLDGPGGTFAGGPRTTDPALANTIWGPQGNAAIHEVTAELAERPPVEPPETPSQRPAQTDRPAPGRG